MGQRYSSEGEVMKIFTCGELTAQKLNKFQVTFPTNIKTEHKRLFVAT